MNIYGWREAHWSERWATQIESRRDRVGIETDGVVIRVQPNALLNTHGVIIYAGDRRRRLSPFHGINDGHEMPIGRRGIVLDPD